MNQEQEFRWWSFHWWRSWWGNINRVFLIVSILISVLVFISIILDDMIASGPGQISFWEWVGVLVIPLALLAAGTWLHNEQVRYENIARNQHGQDEALRQYLDQMSNLLVDKQLRRRRENSDARLLAQARTTAILFELHDTRKRRPLKLIYRLHPINKPKPILTLENAALDNADLREITLRDADLRGADLRRANLSGAILRGANLLPYDEQDPAKLNSYNLNGVDPRNIDLSGDSLRLTNLSGAILRGAELNGANLAYANLKDVKGVTNEELERQANSLKSATMPDGSIHD